jgi:hypothetical protein
MDKLALLNRRSRALLMLVEWASFVLVALMMLAIGAAVGSTASLRAIGALLIAGAAMRIVGVLARHWMIFDLYDGGSDAVGYFDAGRVIAEHFRALDFSIVGSGQWGNREWGTQAVRYAAGVAMTFVGPSMRGTFLAFSFAAFVGLVCTIVAYGRAHAGSMRQASLLLFFWPSLWFWPSSIGKEAVLLLAVGLVTLGYVGCEGRIRWLPMTAGLSLALVIRPHLAGVLAVSTCVAEWTTGGWTTRRFAQSIFTSILAVWLLVKAFGMLGLEQADYGSIESFVLHSSGQTFQGGSAFDRADSLPVAVPMAFLNILFRPFIIEAHSSMALVSSLEMMVFWWVVIRNRRHIATRLRSWGDNRFVRFAVPFVLLYIVMIGITFQNFGIIARQRALVMPALLLVMAGVPAFGRHRRRAVAGRPRRIWNDMSAGHPVAADARR